MNQSTLLMYYRERAKACVTSLAIRKVSVYEIVLDAEAVDRLRSPERYLERKTVIAEFLGLSNQIKK